MVRLGDVATYINGYAFKPSDWSDTGLPIIRIQDLSGNSYQANRYNGEYSPKYEVNDGDVLISWSASLGVYVWHGEKALLNQHIFKVVFDKISISKEFFVYQVENILEKASSEAHGATMKHLTKPVFDALPFYLPPFDEQHKIAAALDKLSDLMDKRRQQMSKLDEIVKSRFIEMFGDPVQNPLEWSTRPLLEMGYCKNGMNYHTGDCGIKVHCLGVGDFKNYSVIDGTNHLPIVSLNEAPSEESMLQDGDIVFVRSNGNKALVGRCLVVYPRSTPTTYSGFCIRYRLTSDEVNTAYLLRVLKTDSMRERMAGRGANIQNLNQQILATLDIPTPPMELQEQFAAFVETTDKSKYRQEKCIGFLRCLEKNIRREWL